MADPSRMKDMLEKLLCIGHIQRGHSMSTMLVNYDNNDLHLRKVDHFLVACCFNFSMDWMDYLITGKPIEAFSKPESQKLNVLSKKPPDHILYVDRETKQSTNIPPRKGTHNAVVSKIETVENVVLGILFKLDKMYSSGNNFPKFRSVAQRDMILVAVRSLENVEDHVFILRTGGGKTAGIAVCCMTERERGSMRVTIVFCPLRSLCEDLKRRFQEMGLRAEYCSNANVKYDIISGLEILIIAPEVANSSTMYQHLQRLHAENRLGSLWYEIV